MSPHQGAPPAAHSDTLGTIRRRRTDLPDPLSCSTAPVQRPARPLPSPRPLDPKADTRGQSGRVGSPLVVVVGPQDQSSPASRLRQPPKGDSWRCCLLVWRPPCQAARRFTGRRVGGTCGAANEPSRVRTSTTSCRSVTCSLELPGNEATYGLRPSAFVTGKSGSVTSSVTFGLRNATTPSTSMEIFSWARRSLRALISAAVSVVGLPRNAPPIPKNRLIP